MPKLERIQALITNDLTLFRKPFWETMEPVQANGEPRFQASSLEYFETWLINGIVGGCEPSTYSNSLELWNPYFQALGERGVFFPFDLPLQREFDAFLVTLLSVPGFLELTVTDPYKTAAWHALTQLNHRVQFSEQAQHLQVVNHVILDGPVQVVLGLNTDGLGMIRAMETKADIRGGKALILGAGGAAASIAYELVRLGNDLFIANRTISRAEALAGLLKGALPGKVNIRWGGLADLPGVLETADIVVNTVSEGCPVGIAQAGKLKEGALLADTKYGSKAELKALAELTGSPYVDGNEMLYGQFVEAARWVYPLLGVSQEVHDQALSRIGYREAARKV